MNKMQIEQDSIHASALEAEPIYDPLTTLAAEPAAVLTLMMAEGSGLLEPGSTGMTPTDEEDKPPIKK